ncbi:MAG: hypothetical protein K6E20_05980 [Acholeplasmatales bacterium]|nr:hypothetical protein [Acholeplasmatales bacterium]
MSKMIYDKDFFIHTSFVDRYDYLRPFAIWELFQATAGKHADLIGVGFDDVVKLNLLWIVQYQEFKVVGNMPKYGQTVHIKTWPHEKNRLEFPREYEIYDGDGNLSITAISSWFIVDKDSHRIVRGDEVKFNGEFEDFTHYPNYRRKKLNLEPVGDVKKFNYKVLLTDLDHNGHTNNAKYFDMVYNMGMTQIKDIKGGAISFIKEALVNENLTIEYFKNSDNFDCYKGFNENNEAVFEIILEV